MAGKKKELQLTKRQNSGGPKVLCCLLAAAVTVAGLPGFSVSAADYGWAEEDSRRYWYEDGVKQGTEGRGKEIYDPASTAWYWLDVVQGGALTRNKDGLYIRVLQQPIDHIRWPWLAGGLQP